MASAVIAGFLLPQNIHWGLYGISCQVPPSCHSISSSSSRLLQRHLNVVIAGCTERVKKLYGTPLPLDVRLNAPRCSQLWSVARQGYHRLSLPLSGDYFVDRGCVCFELTRFEAEQIRHDINHTWVSIFELFYWLCTSDCFTPHFSRPEMTLCGVSPDVILCGWLGLKHQLTNTVRLTGL